MPTHRLTTESFAVQSRLPLRSSRRGGCGRRFASAVRALFAPRVPLRAARGRPPPHALLGRLRLPAAASLAAPFLAPARCRGVPLLSASGGGRLRWRFAAPALGLGWGGGAQAAAHRATQAVVVCWLGYRGRLRLRCVVASLLLRSACAVPEALPSGYGRGNILFRFASSEVPRPTQSARSSPR